MRIGLVASHAWPLPSPARTGDSSIILDLSRSLYEMGHEVCVFAPAGSKLWPGVELMPMPLCSHGQAQPSTDECEAATLEYHFKHLVSCDVVHDCSVNKRVAEFLNARSHPCVSTIWGGAWQHPNPPINIIAQSFAQRDRLLRGATDYENTATPDAGGPNVEPIKEAHVVYNGIDTDFYCPSHFEKGSYFLWLNRWHPVKGYRNVLELARIRPDVEILMAGEHPDRDHPYQAGCAREVVEAAKALANVRVEFLPADPDHHTRKRELLRGALGFLYPTQFQEPFGLSQVEALACGTPVVAPKRGSVGEVLAESISMLIVCGDGEVKAMGHALGFMRGDDEAYWLCREKAVKRFDRFVMARNYVEQYRLVIEGKGWGA